MSCSKYHDTIQELADGGLGPIRRAELQVHLESCPPCRALAADLLRMKELAASLEQPSPPDSVWLQIAGRLRQEGRITSPARMPRPSRNRLVPLALAASLAIGVAASMYMLPRGGDGAAEPGAAPQGNVEAEDPVQSFASEIRLAEQHYQNAIAKLEQAAASDEDVLDPQTAAILKRNLQVIDEAIAESRDALRVEPQSAPARDSLFEALRRKVVVLQDTIALVNEIRKGNPAGIGQLAEGSDKS